MARIGAGGDAVTVSARFEVHQFAGYSLWVAVRRTKANQRWAAALLSCGRTDTEDQAHGEIARLLDGIPIADIRTDTWRWSGIRNRLRQPGEPRRMEGVTAWEARRTELGPAGLDALATDGRAFLAAFQAEQERKAEESRQRFFQSVEWAAFCVATGRSPLAGYDPSAMGEFSAWQAERREREYREQRERFERFVFEFRASTDSRADDLALLGLSTNNATAGDIKAAWRRAAMRLHPDRGGDQSQFVMAKAAYTRLMEATA